MTINELFAAITTSRIDVEAMIAESTDKEQTFRHLMWHIPTGIRYTQDETMVENISEFIKKTEEALGVNANEIFNEDGMITDIEKLGMGGSTVEPEVEPVEDLEAE